MTPHCWPCFLTGFAMAFVFSGIVTFAISGLFGSLSSEEIVAPDGKPIPYDATDEEFARFI
jgi:hypothetical protein